MKKIVIFSIFLLIIITGCSKNNEKGIIKDLKSKADKDSSYYLEGDLEIVNNDNVYNYKVEVSHKKGDYYKVSLVNTSNDHEQIILKNTDGVYVITPSLNKSFKFQSDWPYSNSQIYLLEAIVNDIENDSNRVFSKENNGYKFSTTVNYPNNKTLVKQDILLNKRLNIENIKVYNDDDIPLMTMNFNKIDYSPTFKKDHFSLTSALNASKTTELTKEVSVIDDVVYPLFLPTGTKLVSEERIKKENGERVIMTFDGEKPFLLVEETVSVFDELTIVPTNGEPYLLQDTLGTLTNNSLTWTSGAMEYYLVSDVLSQQELVEIAQSISVLPTMK